MANYHHCWKGWAMGDDFYEKQTSRGLTTLWNLVKNHNVSRSNQHNPMNKHRVFWLKFHSNIIKQCFFSWIIHHVFWLNVNVWWLTHYFSWLNQHIQTHQTQLFLVEVPFKQMETQLFMVKLSFFLVKLPCLMVKSLVFMVRSANDQHIQSH